ncbi:MAG TPA: hypothetical protein VMS18_26965 [Candidatus Binatia bacterium]|nr:hypothetical protein [Candidatus Binatia bacterium]
MKRSSTEASVGIVIKHLSSDETLSSHDQHRNFRDADGRTGGLQDWDRLLCQAN